MSDVDRFETAGLDLPPELVALSRQLQELAVNEPTTRTLGVEVAFENVTQMVARRQRILNLVQEALSQLRLDVKYLMFDLEATRREREEYRVRLEETEREF